MYGTVRALKGTERCGKFHTSPRNLACEREIEREGERGGDQSGGELDWSPSTERKSSKSSFLIVIDGTFYLSGIQITVTKVVFGGMFAVRSYCCLVCSGAHGAGRCGAVRGGARRCMYSYLL
ncbi:hypothetical protein PoB_004813400 [Plakobranchus ocellatus]|uniref:Uncharacterized protein n=1 Tax=Plakobranchus ocellatus TaxID=259542 RepID=A0AAV4BTD5_9GAST|nr:hypothetical protein PoB_004813400 [Plakobranchus ocellatus]